MGRRRSGSRRERSPTTSATPRSSGARAAPTRGAALALGAFLDGLPEQFVLGLGIAIGDGVSAGLLAAIFVSNLPEAIGSATAMRAPGAPAATCSSCGSEWR